MFKRLLLCSALAMAIPAFAHAQQPGATVVDADACPVITVLAPGNSRPLIQTRQGHLCVEADFSGMITIGTVVQGTPAAATFAAAWPVYQVGYSFSHISTATTTLVKSGAGVLHTICINTLGTVASTVEFDNATTHTTPIMGILNSLTTGQGCYTYDVAFSTGLSITTTGTSAPDITVSYR